jgi:hypothetical protein
MRNVVLADSLAASRGVVAGVIAAYADGEGFDTAKKVRAGQLGLAGTRGKTLITPISYQSIVALAQSISAHPTLWEELGSWVNRKIASAAAFDRDRERDWSNGEQNDYPQNRDLKLTPGTAILKPQRLADYWVGRAMMRGCANLHHPELQTPTRPYGEGHHSFGVGSAFEYLIATGNLSVHAQVRRGKRL